MHTDHLVSSSFTSQHLTIKGQSKVPPECWFNKVILLTGISLSQQMREKMGFFLVQDDFGIKTMKVQNAKNGHTQSCKQTGKKQKQSSNPNPQNGHGGEKERKIIPNQKTGKWNTYRERHRCDRKYSKKQNWQSCKKTEHFNIKHEEYKWS